MNPNDRSVVSFVALGHALFHTYELSIPVFVTVWLNAFGASKATLGLVVGVGYALVGLGALPSGILADRYSSRRLVAVCIGGMALGFGVLMAAPGLLGVAVALSIWGVAASLYHPAALSLISRGTEETGTAFALHGAAGNVGTVVGPLSAAVLLAVLNWRLVAALFVVPALVAAVGAYRIDFEEGGGVDAEVRSTPSGLEEVLGASRSLFTGGFVAVFAVVMLYGLFYRGVLTFLPAVLSRIPSFEPVTLGATTFEPGRYVYAGLLAVGVGGQYVGGRLTDVTSSVRLLTGAFAALAAISVLFPLAVDAGPFVVVAICIVLGFLVYGVAPIYQAAIADYTSSESRGLSYGFTYLGMFGIGALGAAVAGGVLAFADAATLFLVLAALAIVASGVSLRLAVA